jgi:hypothetical protein
MERSLYEVQLVLSEEHFIANEEGRRAEHASLHGMFSVDLQRCFHLFIRDQCV